MCIKGVKDVQINVRFSKYVVIFILLNKIVVFVAKFCPKKSLYFFYIYVYISSAVNHGFHPLPKKNKFLSALLQAGI